MKINKDDKILINGKVIKKKLKTWQKEIVIMHADHIYNETEEFGY